MSSKPFPMPKIAQQFVADAEAAGFTVKVNHDDTGLDVWVERGDTNAGITWHETNVYDSPLSSERLGFRTHSASRTAVRFSHATVYVRGAYKTPRSVRQVRALIGLVA